jgi:predicted negative regulator of RcsB-dependent stress response
MAAYDLEEQEQLANIKAWWSQYGNMLTWVLLAFAVALVSWQGWNWLQRDRAAQASKIYGALQRAVAERDVQRVKTAGGELLDKYGDTAYGPLAALLAGKLAFESGDGKTAKAQFGWARDHGKDEVRDLASLRLASVLIDEKSYDEAIKLLGEPSSPAFATRFHETRGDALLAQGKGADAKAAYRLAIEKAEVSEPAAGGGKNARRNSGYRDFLQQKIDAIGGGK